MNPMQSPFPGHVPIQLPKLGRWLQSLAVAGAMALSASVLAPQALAQTAAKKPNILVIWGDDIGQFNISAYNNGMMGYKTPNIDRIAKRRRDVHRLVRPAELHRRPRRLHHRAVADPHRPDQGRPAGRARGHEEGRPDDRHAAEARRAT